MNVQFFKYNILNGVHVIILKFAQSFHLKNKTWLKKKKT